MIDPYGRTTVGRYSDGSPMQVTNQFKAMIDAVCHNLGCSVQWLQGSWHLGSLSAGTHSRSGVADYWPNGGGVTPEQFAVEFRRIGGVDWVRNPDQGDWGWHIHGIDPTDQDLDSLAAAQVAGYKDGRNGLGPWPFGPDYHRAFLPIPTFNTEDDMPTFEDRVPGTQQTLAECLAVLPGLATHFAAFRKQEADRDDKEMAVLQGLSANLPAQVAAAVEAALPTDGVDRQTLVAAARAGAQKAIRDVFSTLGTPKEKEQAR